MKKSKRRIVSAISITTVIISVVCGVTALAAGVNWSIDETFNHVLQSNGRIEYDYENDGDLTGENDVVIDADDIKALEKKSEVALYGNFVPDTNADGTGTLYIRVGENPNQDEGGE